MASVKFLLSYPFDCNALVFDSLNYLLSVGNFISEYVYPIWSRHVAYRSPGVRACARLSVFVALCLGPVNIWQRTHHSHSIVRVYSTCHSILHFVFLYTGRGGEETMRSKISSGGELYYITTGSFSAAVRTVNYFLFPRFVWKLALKYKVQL